MTTAAKSAARRTTPRGHVLDPIFEALCFAAATTLLVSLGGVLISLMIGGWPAFAHFGVRLFHDRHPGTPFERFTAPPARSWEP